LMPFLPEASHPATRPLLPLGIASGSAVTVA
jgi:hypothetical protein